MTSIIKSLFDLTRLHFGPVWPLLFCSGAMLGFEAAGTFSWRSLIHIAFIGLLGGTGGIVLNDIVDRDYDKKDVEKDGLTRYWRPFGSRPVAQGGISAAAAVAVFCLLTIATLVLAAFLPFPQSACVAAALCYCYLMEWFYQVKKRNQRFPVSQLLGRTDFALFPAAGYMAVAGPAPLAFLYMAAFYPLAQVHLGVNDLADIRNDEARGMKSIPMLYGTRGCAWWIALFAVAHVVILQMMMGSFTPWTRYAMMAPLCLLATASIAILASPTPRRGLCMLPLIHATIALEAGVLITAAAVGIAAR